MATWERIDLDDLPVFYDIEAWAQWNGLLSTDNNGDGQEDGGWIGIAFSPDPIEGFEPEIMCVPFTVEYLNHSDDTAIDSFRYRGGGGIEEIDLYWSEGDGQPPVSVGDNTQTFRELVDARQETIYARVDRYDMYIVSDKYKFVI